MSETILIWGAGAIGATLGAYWARAGEDVLLVDIHAGHVAACEAQGLRISGPVEQFSQRVTARTPEALQGRYSRIVLAVKAQHTATAVWQLLPHLTDDGYVLSAQNGLNELEIAAVVGAQRTIGAFVNFGADWQAPGEILLGNRGAVVVGEIDGSILPRTRALHHLLQIFEPDALLSKDVWSYLWGKLGYGAMLFGTALTMDSMADNFADPARAPIWIGLAREVMAVASAKGIRPRGFNGFEPLAFTPGAAESAAYTSVAALAEFNRHTAKTHSGIWRDLAVRKRPTEVDAQLGIVARLGAEVGVETPLIRRLVTLIHDIETGHRQQSLETLKLLARALS